MFQRLLPFRFGLLFFLQPLLFLFQPGGVVALKRNAVPAIQFQNPARDVVEKVPVVGHGDDGAFVLLQMLLQPLHRFGIEMVGRLIEQQNVGLLDHEAAERHTAFFAS